MAFFLKLARLILCHVKYCLTYNEYIWFSDAYSKSHQKFRCIKMLKER